MNLSKIELLQKFVDVATPFLTERLNETTIQNLINSYDQMIKKLQSDGMMRYTLMRKFVDRSTKQMKDQGHLEINVLLSNDRVVSIEEYCEILTNKKRFEEVLWDVIQNLKFEF